MLRNWLSMGAACCAFSLVSVVSADAVAQGKPKPAKPAAPAKGAPKAEGDAAKPNLAEAKQHYTNGEAKFKAGDFAGALTEFQAADAIKATAQAARYIGLSSDKLGKYADAVAAFERFLADPPAKLQGEVDGIKKRVEEIKAMPGKVKVETVPLGATLTVDGKPSLQPPPIELDLAPGKHTLVAKADGREAAERSVDVTFASKQDVKLELKELPPPAPPPVAKVEPPPPAPAPAAPPPPPEPRSMVPAFITGGLAIVAAGVGTAFGVMALGDKSDFDKTPTAEKADDGENHALVADMAFGVAITMGVTSAVLFLTRDEPAAGKTAKKSKWIAPTASPRGGGALFRF